MAKLTGEDAVKAVIKFKKLKAENDKTNKKFNVEKQKFYDTMEEFFETYPEEVNSNSVEFAEYVDSDGSGAYPFNLHKVTRIQKVTLNWDTEALRKVLADKADRVINETYTVNDFEGLAKYVRSLGGKASVFRKFFNKEESVDTSALDNLSEVGEVNDEEVAKCCTAKCGKPWFRITSSSK